MESRGWGFPFRIDEIGRVATQTGDANTRAQVLQVLLTAPGERVMQPEFGSGMRDLVFEPNNEILAATTEFAVGRALQRWLPEEVVVERVAVAHVDAQLNAEVVYLRRSRLERGRIKIAF